MKLKNKILQITCDGGAATGKSTGAKMISKKYKLKFLSSGLLYRYAGYLILKNNPHLTELDKESIIAVTIILADFTSVPRHISSQITKLL